MRKNKIETADSRQRIVTQAARMFRERGTERVSVGEVMQAAGMTHGGFYNHFASKDALMAAAGTAAFAEKLDVLNDPATGMSRATLLGYIDQYLSAEHAADLGTGCPVAGLGADAARSSGDLANAIRDGVEQTLAVFERDLAGPVTKRRAQAIRVLATMVGSVMLARACGTDELGVEVIQTMREAEPLRSLLASQEEDDPAGGP